MMVKTRSNLKSELTSFSYILLRTGAKEDEVELSHNNRFTLIPVCQFLDAPLLKSGASYLVTMVSVKLFHRIPKIPKKRACFSTF